MRGGLDLVGGVEMGREGGGGWGLDVSRKWVWLLLFIRLFIYLFVHFVTTRGFRVMGGDVGSCWCGARLCYATLERVFFPPFFSFRLCVV